LFRWVIVVSHRQNKNNGYCVGYYWYSTVDY
jgi:hypothetical protein